uniref:Uncharacterized protein n=1 Tax=Romanomermis culicivorax TaxID=13658 RepID=A0A915HJM6_ROMCU
MECAKRISFVAVVVELYVAVDFRSATLAVHFTFATFARQSSDVEIQ